MPDLLRQLHFVAALTLLFVWLALPLISIAHASHGHRFCDQHQSFEEAGLETPSIPISTDGEFKGPAISALPQINEALHALCVFPIVPLKETLLAESTVDVSIEKPESDVTLNISLKSHTPQAMIDLAPKASPPLA